MEMMESIEEIMQRVPPLVASLGPLGPFVFFALFVLVECFSLPGAPLMLASGPLFGTLSGCLITILSLVTAATISFLLARTVLRPQLMKLVKGNKTFDDINAAVQGDGFKIIFLLRLAPLLPFALSNYAYGVSKVAFWDFFFATLLGVFPGSCATVYIASSAAEMAAEQESRVIPWYVSVLAAVATILLLKVVSDSASKAVQKSVKAREAAQQ